MCFFFVQCVVMTVLSNVLCGYDCFCRMFCVFFGVLSNGCVVLIVLSNVCVVLLLDFHGFVCFCVFFLL